MRRGQLLTALLALLLGQSLIAGCTREAAPAETAASAPAVIERTAQRVRVGEARHAAVGGLSGVAGITSAFRTASVAAEVNARVVERHVEPGQHVAEGDPLVTLDDTHLAITVAEAQATLEAREVDVAEAKRELARGDELAGKGVISEGRHDDLRFAGDRARTSRDLAVAALRRARRSRADAIVRAPFSGTVERIDAQVGDYLAPGVPVATVADFARVRLRAGVTAAEADLLKPGAPATVLIPAMGGYETDAAIHSVALMSDPKTGTYPVELWLDNPELRIRGGMVGELRLTAAADTGGVVVPRAAVLRHEGRLAVYVVEERDGALRAFTRPVRVGRQQGDFVELLEGIEIGERVVVEGLFALTNGAAVFIDEQRAPQQKGDTAWNG